MDIITKETIESFLNAKDSIETKAEQIFNLIDRKEIDSRYHLYGTEIEDNVIKIRIGGCFMGEWDEDCIFHPIEYMWMDEAEILEAEEKRKNEIEEEKRKEEEERRKENEERQKREELALLKRLKEKYEK